MEQHDFHSNLGKLNSGNSKHVIAIPETYDDVKYNGILEAPCQITIEQVNTRLKAQLHINMESKAKIAQIRTKN